MTLAATAGTGQNFNQGHHPPDFNPIENAFAKLKANLRKAAERTVGGLWDAVGRIIDTYTPAESTNYFAAAGYLQPDRLTL